MRLSLLAVSSYFHSQVFIFMRLSSLALPWIVIFARKCDCHAMVNSLAIARIAISTSNLRLSSLRLYGSLENGPKQIVSVSKSYVVDRWNSVLCLQKSLCSRPVRCHRRCFSRRLGEHFILVYYRSAWLDTGGPCPKISPAQPLCSWTLSSSKELVDHTFLSVVVSLTIFTGNWDASNVGIYSVDPRNV